jgi:hypothetical protein
MRLLTLATGAVLAAACLSLSAQTLKPGLWEISNKMQGGGMDDAMAELQKQMAQMPPQQRKQMEAAMAQQGVKMAPGSGGGMAIQMCFTKEMVERNDVPMGDSCTTTQNQRSGNTQKFAFTCSNPPSSGEGQVTYNGPEAYGSRMTVKTVAGGKPQVTTMEASGKWLKADCGSVKPMPLPKK